MKRIMSILLVLLMSAVPALAMEGGLPKQVEPTPISDAMWEQCLRGSWHEDNSVGSGFAERMIFTEEQVYILPSQYLEGDFATVIASWKVLDGKLYIDHENYKEPLSLLGPFEMPEGNYTPMVEIGTIAFYKFSHDPGYFYDLEEYGIKIEPDANPSVSTDFGDDFYEEGDDSAFDMERLFFDIGVVDIEPEIYGGPVQCARVGNWTVAYGNCDNHFCLFGYNWDNYEYHILAETIASSIVPAGDMFAYFGEVRKGKFGWLTRDPNVEKPRDLSLGDRNEIFWADEHFFYYYTYGSGAGGTYSRMDHDGKNKKKLGTLNGRPIAIMQDGKVIVFNSSKDRVECYTEDGTHSTLYDPGKEIMNVVTLGESIWVDHQNEFGLLEDGKLSFTFPGTLRCYAKTANQLIALLDRDRARFELLMFNDNYRAYARMGLPAAQNSVNLELTPGYINRAVLWGSVDSIEFYAPPADNFLPYGCYSVEDALAAGYKLKKSEPIARS